MRDLSPQGKMVFWIILATTLAFIMVPSIALVESLQSYWRLLSGWEPGTLQLTRVSRVPHGPGLPQAELKPVEVRFVEFGLHAPRAKRVLLAGTFNRWRADTLPLYKNQNRWEVLVPLPSGRHEYLFQVDGVWTLDPASTETGKWGERTTSIRQVR